MKIPVCNVMENLKLSDDEGDDMTEHIIGTHVSDLTQIYNGHISIQGSINMNNVFVSNERVQNNSSVNKDGWLEWRPIVINGVPFNIDHLYDEYWMKSSDQVKHMWFINLVICILSTNAQ